MSQFVYINFYKTTLSAALSATATTMSVGSTSGLPTLAVGQVMPLVLTDAATQQVHEIVYVTGISSSTLTIERGMEGTSALTWAVGDYVACSTTAGSVLASNSVQATTETLDVTGTATINNPTFTGTPHGNPYDIASGVSGPIAASQVVLYTVSVRAIDIPANFAGSIALVGTAFTNAATFTINHNGVAIGTLAFAAGGTVATFSTLAAFTLAVGDTVSVNAPSTSDPTAANLTITLFASLA
ncbi:MAG: hypothetical protein GJU73_06360 [Ferrovum sp.]|jgi:hypothetical protein|uniref:hypothetical protein n=1 Tax=Ferrovum sp. TaxID=2609467 RepID=UPI00263031DF|nr:hypothetical protein [Ferrovum sp.]MBW8067055.1 hypothetical protein [Ferrovum sp.]